MKKEQVVMGMSKLGMNRLPLFVGAGCGAAFVSGFAYEFVSGSLGMALVLGVSGAAVLELGVAVSAVNGKLRLLLPSIKRSRQQTSNESVEKTPSEAPESLSTESGASLSVVPHPALGQVEMSSASLPLRDTTGGIYIDSMDVLREGLQKLDREESKPEVSEPKVETIGEPVGTVSAETSRTTATSTTTVSAPIVSAPAGETNVAAVTSATNETVNAPKKYEKVANTHAARAKEKEKEKVKEQPKPAKKGKVEKKKSAPAKGKVPEKQAAPEKNQKAEKAAMLLKVKNKPKH